MSFMSEIKFLKIWSLYYYNVGNGLHRVFTTARRALSFQQYKMAFIQEILFPFFKWGTLAQKKGHFFHLSMGGGAHAPIPPPRFRCP
jgi:hypothetical protein